MKNLILSLSIISCFLVSCNPDDDNNPNPNPTNLSHWENVGELFAGPLGGAFGFVYCWKIYNGELYVGGGFSSINNVVARGFAKWNGSSWSPVVGSPIENVNGEYAVSMEVYNVELYVKYFNFPAHKYNGSTWSNIDTILNNPFDDGNRDEMVIYNGSLYNANIIFDGISGLPIVSTSPSISDTFSTAPYSYCIYNNKLYCSGKFRSSINANFYGLYKWENNEWKRAAGQTISEPLMYSMAVFNNEMYVAGSFNSVGGQQINNLAKMNGSTWGALQGISSSGRAYLFADNNYIYFSPEHTGTFFNIDASQNMDSAFTNVVRYDGTNWEYVSDSAHIKNVYGPIIKYNSYLYAQSMDENNMVSIVRVQPQ